MRFHLSSLALLSIVCAATSCQSLGSDPHEWDTRDAVVRAGDRQVYGEDGRVEVVEASAPRQPRRRPLLASDFEQFRTSVTDAGIWSGGPAKRYEWVGRKSFAKMVEIGLQPDDKVLDVGAGSLRVGWWILNYIDPENYYAIEPVESRILPVVDMLDVDINLYHNMDFEYPSEKFDWVIARSIWSHASKWMISKMISEFAENSAPQGKFLTSVVPALTAEEDYMGEEWYGKIQKDDKPGIIKHSLDWIDAECAKHGLIFTEQGVIG
ncbi:MAG: class I SAM-dependent methyltransferase, partial [Planctomycetota bacterium]